MHLRTIQHQDNFTPIHSLSNSSKLFLNDSKKEKFYTDLDENRKSNSLNSLHQKNTQAFPLLYFFFRPNSETNFIK